MRTWGPRRSREAQADKYSETGKDGRWDSALFTVLHGPVLQVVRTEGEEGVKSL